MITCLKPIQQNFTITSQEHLHGRVAGKRRNYQLRLFICCNSKGGEGGGPPTPPEAEGDVRRQELLARMAMLQAQKVRLTDYLDERSAYLTQYAEDASAEFDQVGENALKELDQAGARIMENIETQMQAFEESAESSKLEIEENQKKLNEFEDRIQNERNEGMFFKNLGQSKPGGDKKIAKVESEKIKEKTKQSVGSETRRNIYLGLIGLVGVSIIDSFVSQTPDWRKSAVLAAILVGLVTQFTYEQRMLSETDRIQTKESEEKKE